MPLWRSSASIRGSRPRKATKDSSAGRLPPTAEDLAPEARADLGVEHALLLEQAVGVGRQHLGPLVAVVAGRVAAGEDVREAVREAVVRRRDHHRHLAPDLLEQLQRRRASRRVEVVMQVHVEQRELQLPHELQAALEVLGRQHLVEQRARERLLGVHVRGHALRARPTPSRSSP